MNAIFPGNIPMAFVRIPAGTFMMGSEEYDDEKPVHKVRVLKAFWMQATEVTQAQWRAVMGENPSYFKGDDLPVENGSWSDCREFLKKLNVLRLKGAGGRTFDLPTEAEWEYASRAGSTGKWCFGDDESKLGEYAWYRENSGGKTHPAGGKKPNAWGLHDMHGNVWEWCKDRYGPYKADPVKDPQGPRSGNCRVLRGGGWYYFSRYTRSADRYWLEPTSRYDCVGLRLVLR